MDFERYWGFRGSKGDQVDLLRYWGLRRISWDLEGSKRVNETYTMGLLRLSTDFSDIDYSEIWAPDKETKFS